MAEEQDKTPEQEYDEAFDQFLIEEEEQDEAQEQAAQESQADEEVTSDQDTPTDLDWASVPEPYREAYERAVQEAQDWQHRYKSDEGRILAAQRRLAELSQNQESVSEGSASQGSEGKTAERESDQPLDQDQWNQLKQELPEIASALESYLSRVQRDYEQKLQQTVQTLEQRLQPLQQIEQERYIEAQLQILDRRIPNWRDMVVDQKFTEWLSSQPEPVRVLAGSQNADEVSTVLYAYMAASGARPGDEGEPTSPGIRQSRQERKARAATVTPPRTAAAPKSGVPEDDYDAAWDYFATHDE